LSSCTLISFAACVSNASTSYRSSSNTFNKRHLVGIILTDALISGIC
jgi:hypothetical protein